MLQKPNTTFSLNHVHDTKCEIPIGFTKEEKKVNYVRQALKNGGTDRKICSFSCNVRTQ